MSMGLPVFSERFQQTIQQVKIIYIVPNSYDNCQPYSMLVVVKQYDTFEVMLGKEVLLYF